jgi:GNAT superfamily N-acetyltransferase
MNAELAELESPLAREWEAMTFPVYRHLLSLAIQPRHPEQGDTNVIQPLAIGARRAGAPVAFLLAECPVAAGGVPELLSIYTKPELRNQGLATTLVAKLEAMLSARGYAEVAVVYMLGKPSIPALERVLEKRSWSPPATRTVTLRFTPEQALETAWFGRLRLRPPAYEIFPWVELTDEERAELKRSQAESPWIAPGLEPWRHDRAGFDSVSSVGLRYQGKVVGWVINHEIEPGLVRFTCSFMRRDLARHGRIMPLYTEAIERLRAAGCRECMFITPLGYEEMVNFVKRRCAPWATSFAETRGSGKTLAPAASHRRAIDFHVRP